MKKWKPIKNHIVLCRAIHQRGPPSRMQLIAVRVLRKLGLARGPACMKKCCKAIGSCRVLKLKSIAASLAQSLVKIKLA